MVLGAPLPHESQDQSPRGRATRFARCVWSEVVTQPPRQGHVVSPAGSMFPWHTVSLAESIFPGYEALTQKSQLQGQEPHSL